MKCAERPAHGKSHSCLGHGFPPLLQERKKLLPHNLRRLCRQVFPGQGKRFDGGSFKLLCRRKVHPERGRGHIQQKNAGLGFCKASAPKICAGTVLIITSYSPAVSQSAAIEIAEKPARSASARASSFRAATTGLQFCARRAFAVAFATRPKPVTATRKVSSGAEMCLRSSKSVPSAVRSAFLK